MKLQSLLEKIEKAQETPSEKCLTDKEHNFKFIIHANEKDFSSYYYECGACKEIVVQKLKK